MSIYAAGQFGSQVGGTFDTWSLLIRKRFIRSLLRQPSGEVRHGDDCSCDLRADLETLGSNETRQRRSDLADLSFELACNGVREVAQSLCNVDAVAHFG